MAALLTAVWGALGRVATPGRGRGEGRKKKKVSSASKLRAVAMEEGKDGRRFGQGLQEKTTHVKQKSPNMSSSSSSLGSSGRDEWWAA